MPRPNNNSLLICPRPGVSLSHCLWGKPFLPGVPWFMEVTYSLLNVRNSAGWNINIFFKQVQRTWTSYKGHNQMPSKLQSHRFQTPPDFSFVHILSTIWTTESGWPAWLSYQRDLLLSCNDKSGSEWQFNSKSHFSPFYTLKHCQVINFTQFCWQSNTTDKNETFINNWLWNCS